MKPDQIARNDSAVVVDDDREQWTGSLPALVDDP